MIEMFDADWNAPRLNQVTHTAIRPAPPDRLLLAGAGIGDGSVDGGLHGLLIVAAGLGLSAGAVGGVPLAHPLRLGGLALAVLLAGQTGLSGQLGL